MEGKLFLLQRLSAMVMGPFVIVHLIVILYAVQGGLTAGEILSRTQGNAWWIGFYVLFVLAVSVHAPIGVRKVLIEWCRMSRKAAGGLSLVLGIAMLVLGLRAVVAIGGVGA